MTERIADPQAACPFVALDDDRDHRAPVPDHRHRCFADRPAAPRALAHQAAYCLSGSFPSCPTFVDWARREAAPVRVDSPVRSLRDAGPTRSAVVPSAGRSGSRAGGSAADWTAPPPWGSAAGAAAAGAAAGPGAEAGPAGASSLAAATSGPDEIDHGEDAEPVDAGVEPAEAAPLADAGGARHAPDDTPAFLAGRAARPTPAPAWDDDDEAWKAAEDAAPDNRDGETARPPVASPRRMPVGYAPVAPGKSERRAGDSRHERFDASAPSWEEPRRLEEYPTLKSRGGAGIPRAAIYALVIVLVGAGLFAAPFLLRGFGGDGSQASPTPAPSASVAPTVEPSRTAAPTSAQVVHTVKSGQTLSGIAANYGVTVDQILAANPTIKNQNRIDKGDKIVIPQPLPSEIVDAEITPAP